VDVISLVSGAGGGAILLVIVSLLESAMAKT
jgi:hypothetical protein